MTSQNSRKRQASAGRGKPVSPELRSQILEEVAGGRRNVDVAREHGIHPVTISKWKAEERRRGHESQESGESTSRETGRYSKAFKGEVLSQANSGRKLSEVARQYSIPVKTIHRWKEASGGGGGDVADPQSTRPHSSGPSPIDPEHRELVLALKSKHPNMGLAQIQNQLKRFEAVRLGRRIIKRILTGAGIQLQKPSRKSERRPAENRFEMTRPNELWAIDFKEIWIHSEKAQVLFVLDDFSRFCVGFALTKEPTAELAINTVETALQRYGRPERILSDRGAQFHAWNGVSRFDKFLDDIDHTVTKAGHPFTNGKLEAFNREVEAELLDVEEFASLKEAKVAIGRHVERHNFFRPHMAIDGLIPADRYFGMVAEAQRALETGLEKIGPGLRWLRGTVSQEGAALRPPTLLQAVLREGKLELVVLGRRFQLAE